MAQIVLTHRVHDEVLEYLAPCGELIANQTAETCLLYTSDAADE